MNQLKLEVPAWVLKVESELEKVWETENRKMKKSAGVGSAGGKVTGKAKINTKAERGNDSNVNVTGELNWLLLEARELPFVSITNHISVTVKQEYSYPSVQDAPRTNGEGYQGGVTLSGLYNIECRIASDTFQDYDFDLILSLDPSQGTWRAAFRCTGEIVFFDNQTIQGPLNEMLGVGTVHFEGVRRLGGNVEDDLQEE
ncbi:hypothetical protein GQ44DRAFT_754642 [Phaeosphaeriaceae sp. PMI808]|nr:hypothetical protein GQ44DRAFT_754642 [Phaeosphaeriaceae sp. PMI808]